MLKKIAFLLIIFTIILSCTPSNSYPQGWVVTSPELAEIIVKLGATENIVGVTKECDFPSDLQNKTIVGNFGKVDIEKVIELNPAKVFLTKLEQEELAITLEKLDIPTFSAYPNSIETLFHTIEEVGKEINRTEQAQELVKNLKTQLSQLQKEQHSAQSRVYIEIYGEPLMSVSDDSYVGQLLRQAGGKNIFPSLPREYSRVSPEKVIVADPQIIIVTYPGISKAQIAARKGWENISAVQNNRIYTVQDIDPDIILRASPRFVQGIKKLQEIIYE
ncbi:MAG: helical backbone metal receptor [Candidatus Cloacimonadota bacterium]|nr:helical backbone metal receptor [Candidatus Cloacimonadota bacterium]